MSETVRVSHYRVRRGPLPRLPVELFRFATTERVELNTAVLYAFGVANERLEELAAMPYRPERHRPAGVQLWRQHGRDCSRCS